MARVALHIHALGPGGAERIALCWANWLQESGHEVYLLLGPHHEDHFFTLPDNVRLVTCPKSRQLGLSVVWLRNWLRNHPPDLAIGITIRPSLNILLASLGRPWPVVIAERNYPPARPLPLLLWLLRYCLYPRASLHLVQTARIGTWLQEHGLARRIATLPNPVLWPLHGAKSGSSLEATQIPSEVPLLLAVGSKPYQKGFDRLLAAFPIIASNHLDCRLALVGVSIDHPELRPVLELLTPAVRARLILPGVVSDIGHWYARATIFVLPSRYEGFPNVLQEAMAAGCACIATDCPTGPRELIQQDINGVLLPEPYNTTDLVLSISSLIKDAPRRQRLARQARLLRKIHAEPKVRLRFLNLLTPFLLPRLLLLAPTRRSPTETFIRANLSCLPMQQQAYFGDEFCELHL